MLLLHIYEKMLQYSHVRQRVKTWQSGAGWLTSVSAMKECKKEYSESDPFKEKIASFASPLYL